MTNIKKNKSGTTGETAAPDLFMGKGWELWELCESWERGRFWGVGGRRRAEVREVVLEGCG